MDQTNFEFGSEITLPCNVDGYPEPIVKWYKNNAGLPPSDRIVVDSLNTLTISRASPIGETHIVQTHVNREYMTYFYQMEVCTYAGQRTRTAPTRLKHT